MTMHVETGSWQLVEGLWVHNGVAHEPILSGLVHNGVGWEEFYAPAIPPTCVSHSRDRTQTRSCPHFLAAVEYNCWGTVADWNPSKYQLDVYYAQADSGGCSSSYYEIQKDVTVTGTEWGPLTVNVQMAADIGGTSETEYWRSDARILLRDPPYTLIDNLVCSCLTVRYRFC